MAQTSDGYIWIGSASGLTRFDGVRFEHVDMPRGERVSTINVFTLYAPASGGLWIGFTFGGVAFLKDGQVTAYSEADGLPSGSVKSLVQDKNGTVWAGTNTGLARLEGSRWRRVGAEAGYVDTQAEALLVDSTGTLWVASRNAAFFLPAGKSVFNARLLSSGATPSALSKWSNPYTTVGLAESVDGTVWLARASELQRLAQNNRGRGPTASNPFLLADRDGALWSVVTSSRFVRLLPDRLDADRVPFPTELTDSSVVEEALSVANSQALLEDREGNVWVASTDGLERFSERNVAAVRLDADGNGGRQNAYAAALVAGEKGDVVVTDRSLGVMDLHGERVTWREGFNGISSAIRSADGTLWLGDSRRVCRVAPGGPVCTPLPAGGGAFEVQAMAQDRSGALWVSIVRNGVFRLADGQWTAYGGIASLPKLTAVTLATDAAGRVWFGYTEGRIAVLDGGKATVYDGASRAPIGNVTALYAQRGRVWAGGEFGLAELHGAAFRALRPAAGSSFDVTTGIVETADGDLWINSAAGIVHVAAAELGPNRDASGPLRSETFDASDGVRGGSGRLRPLPTAIEGSDGRLWFVRSVAIHVIDPARLHRNPVPPTVLISTVSVGDKAYAPTADLRLPAGTSSVNFDYVGLSLTAAEKVRYRFKLDGVDADWHDAQGRRQALYTGLRPGKHRFHVIAANNDGVWNEAGAVLDFVIPPTFVQTGWFIVLCAAGFVLLAWLAVWLRVRQVSARMRARFAERMAERERIARELHDTLLQSTQGLVLRFQAVANRIAADDPNRSMLDDALERADAVMEEGRDRVLDLRLAADAPGDLPEAFAATGAELAQSRSVDFRAVFEGTPRALRPVVKDEIYRIGREALLNAFQHAQATSIEVQLIYADDALRVRIRDDGIGLNAQVLETGSRPDHWGLQGMRERAKRIGARLDVWSRPGAGTEVELAVPAASAYAQAQRWRWLPLTTVFGDSR